jgi:hypothetical protein
MNDWSDEETNEPLLADHRNYYKVEKADDHAAEPRAERVAEQIKCPGNGNRGKFAMSWTPMGVGALASVYLEPPPVKPFPKRRRRQDHAADLHRRHRSRVGDAKHDEGHRIARQAKNITTMVATLTISNAPPNLSGADAWRARGSRL